MTFHFNARHATACALATAMAIAVAGCTGDLVKPSYSRSSLEPVTANQVSEYTLQNIPLLAPRVVMVFADGEDQIFP